MAQRNKRGFVDKETALTSLSVGRSGAIRVLTEAKINSDEYRAAGGVVVAIDELAKQLTGDSKHFHAKGGG